MDKREPTIEEAIERLKDMKTRTFSMGYSNRILNINDNSTFDLAIRGLEEMREREIIFSLRELKSRPGSLNIDSPMAPKPKPRTWRDVTAGELRDLWGSDDGWMASVIYRAKRIVGQSTDPLSTWRSLT